MKFLSSTILTAVLSFAACLYFPWWAIAVVAFVVALIIIQSPLKAYLAAFTGVFALWFLLSFLLSNANGHSLAHRISMMVLKMDNPFLLMAVTAVLGGVVAGFAAAAGSWLRKESKEQDVEEQYQ